MLSSLPVGVIGAGRMCQRAHIPNLLGEQCRIVGIADPRHETAKLVAAHFRIPEVYADYRELVARDDIDAVVAAVPDPLHREIAIAALRAGKHVFIEKPMATNSDDAREMLRAAKEAKKKLAIAYQRRHDPASEIAKRLVDEFALTGELGRLRFMEFKNFGGDWTWSSDPLIDAGDASPEHRADPRHPPWLPQEMTGQFGVYNNGLTHGIDLIQHLVGPPTAVIAAYPDYSATTMALFDWSGVRTLFVAGSTEGSIWQEWLELRYERGWLRLSTPPALHPNHPGVVEVYRGKKGVVERHEAPHEWAFRREIQHFLRCIRDDVAESPTPGEALLSVVIVEELFRQAIRMPEPHPIISP